MAGGIAPSMCRAVLYERRNTNEGWSGKTSYRKHQGNTGHEAQRLLRALQSQTEQQAMGCSGHNERPPFDPGWPWPDRELEVIGISRKVERSPGQLVRSRGRRHQLRQKITDR